MHELLEPRITDASQHEFENTFKNEFSGMTTTSVTHEELKDIRTRLPLLLLESFTDNERMFLMHLKSGTPNWSLLPIENIEHLPGIQWKLQNVNKIPDDKKNEQLNKLKRVLKV